ncbi:MAG: hypothetical protein EBZ77_03725, partial [Chitinophagia bacterium]|nr:hypothetical protein [Chitinophagia bacterium]
MFTVRGAVAGPTAPGLFRRFAFTSAEQTPVSVDASLVEWSLRVPRTVHAFAVAGAADVVACTATTEDGAVLELIAESTRAAHSQASIVVVRHTAPFVPRVAHTASTAPVRLLVPFVAFDGADAVVGSRIFGFVVHEDGAYGVGSTVVARRSAGTLRVSFSSSSAVTVPCDPTGSVAATCVRFAGGSDATKVLVRVNGTETLVTDSTTDSTDSTTDSSADQSVAFVLGVAAAYATRAEFTRVAEHVEYGIDSFSAAPTTGAPFAGSSTASFTRVDREDKGYTDLVVRGTTLVVGREHWRPTATVVAGYDLEGARLDDTGAAIELVVVASAATHYAAAYTDSRGKLLSVCATPVAPPVALTRAIGSGTERVTRSRSRWAADIDSHSSSSSASTASTASSASTASTASSALPEVAVYAPCAALKYGTERFTAYRELRSTVELSVRSDPDYEGTYFVPVASGTVTVAVPVAFPRASVRVYALTALAGLVGIEWSEAATGATVSWRDGTLVLGYAGREATAAVAETGEPRAVVLDVDAFGARVSVDEASGVVAITAQQAPSWGSAPCLSWRVGASTTRFSLVGIDRDGPTIDASQLQFWAPHRRRFLDAAAAKAYAVEPDEALLSDGTVAVSSAPCYPERRVARTNRTTRRAVTYRRLKLPGEADLVQRFVGGAQTDFDGAETRELDGFRVGLVVPGLVDTAARCAVYGARSLAVHEPWSHATLVFSGTAVVSFAGTQAVLVATGPTGNQDQQVPQVTVVASRPIAPQSYAGPETFHELRVDATGTTLDGRRFEFAGLTGLSGLTGLTGL